MTKRIWELDALRGICILGMVLVHLIYDFGSPSLQVSPLYRLLLNWGGICFLLLSGISVTLGSRWFRRGCTVLACGLLCSAATGSITLAGLAGPDAVIYFGILHCLGCCMLLWPCFRKASVPLLAAAGILLCALSVPVSRIVVTTPVLIPLGLTPANFASPDYFPLLPNLGWFLLGAALGRKVYPHKCSRFPRVQSGRFPLSFFCLCGRNSLLIYLLHQPLFFLCAAGLSLLS